MTRQLFHGAKSQWGEGKVHAGVFNERLNRVIAECQKLNPLKGGVDAWDGEGFQGEESQVTCKGCLSNIALARWQPMIDAVAEELERRRHSDWGWTYEARKGVEAWAERTGSQVPNLSPGVIREIAQRQRTWW